MWGGVCVRLFLVPHFLLKMMDSVLFLNFKYLSDFRLLTFHVVVNNAKMSNMTAEALERRYHVMLENTNSLYTTFVIWKGLSCKLSRVPFTATLWRRCYFAHFTFPNINFHVFLKPFSRLKKGIATSSVENLYLKLFPPKKVEIFVLFLVSSL